MQFLLSQKEFLEYLNAVKQVSVLQAEVKRLSKQLDGLWSMYSEILEKVREIDSQL